MQYAYVQLFVLAVNNQFVYCGDTIGAIWVFDLMKELERAGADVVNDLCITGDGDFHLVYQKRYQQ